MEEGSMEGGGKGEGGERREGKGLVEEQDRVGLWKDDGDFMAPWSRWT